MEFDKTKILTAVTADQAKVGQNGWFSDAITDLKNLVQCREPQKLIDIDGEDVFCAFEDKDGNPWALFYPAPEPTYAERQAEWIEKNNIKIGCKVRFIKNIKKNEDGASCNRHDNMIGKIGTICVINESHIIVAFLGMQQTLCPYTAIEPITNIGEYRPFANAEEYKPFRDKVVRNKHLGAFEKVGYYDDKGIMTCEASYRTYGEAFKEFEFEDGIPFGVTK
ncbi:MAG: hypothetical protein WC248_04525 [Candidatus Methanomethylophilaceae archaeon]|jgi:hypothetical protein